MADHPVLKELVAYLRSADARGIIEWQENSPVPYPTWKEAMERLSHGGYATERAGGGYNLTPLGLSAQAAPPEPVAAPTADPPTQPPKSRRKRGAKVPQLTATTINKLVADLPKRMKALEDEKEDRRCLRGKHAPPTAVCRVCGGEVVANIRYPQSHMIGGPRPQGYVAGYYCTGCRLVYRDLPPPLPPLKEIP